MDIHSDSSICIRLRTCVRALYTTKHTYVCIYVCVYIYIYIYIYISICISLSLYIYIYIYLYTRVYNMILIVIVIILPGGARRRGPQHLLPVPQPRDRRAAIMYLRLIWAYMGKMGPIRGITYRPHIGPI